MKLFQQASIEFENSKPIFRNAHHAKKLKKYRVGANLADQTDNIPKCLLAVQVKNTYNALHSTEGLSSYTSHILRRLYKDNSVTSHQSLPSVGLDLFHLSLSAWFLDHWSAYIFILRCAFTFK